MPVNARSCKHLKELLGNAYEDARIKLKNPHAAPPASKSKASSKTSKAATPKSASKRKRKVDDDDDDEDQPAKKTSRTSSSRNSKKDDSDDSDNPPASKKVEVLLANKWDIEKGPDPTGWLISEKLDGVRCVLVAEKQCLHSLNTFAVHFTTASTCTVASATPSRLPSGSSIVRYLPASSPSFN